MPLCASLKSVYHCQDERSLPRVAPKNQGFEKGPSADVFNYLSLAPLFSLKLGLCIIETQLELLLKLRVVLNDLKKQPRGVKIDQVKAFL